MQQLIRQIYKKVNAVSKKTVFLDRDGLLNEEVNYLHHSDQIRLLPTVIESISKLNEQNYIVIVITNQAVVAKRLATIREVKLINDTLVGFLKEKHAYINAIYSCPHHPNADVKKYRVECECRKPKLAMFNQAIKDFNINLDHAYIVGDTTCDIMTGKNLGIPTFLVKTGYAGKDKAYSVTADYICKNLDDAVNIILDK